MNFAHICPTPHLNLTDGRPFHLVLAHLVETDDSYVKFYIDQKERYGCTIIMDNSGFELFKQNKPMMDSSRLIYLAARVRADYIVMTDHPGKSSSETIDEAMKLAPIFKDAGYKTFFVPQGKKGDIEDLLESFRWAADNSLIVDYIGVSILSAPLAFDVESGNNLQRFVSRVRLMYLLHENQILHKIKSNSQNIHMLGMVDGPNEILYMNPFKQFIDSWDSSAAVWAGFNNITFDSTPTGLRDGKFEKEVDFNFETSDNTLIAEAKFNMFRIDELCKVYLT